MELALRLRASVRAGDTVARFGGDEFVVLLDIVTGAADAALVKRADADMYRDKQRPTPAQESAAPDAIAMGRTALV